MSNVIKKAKSLTAIKESVEKAAALLARKEKAESPKTQPAQRVTPETPYKSKLMICIEVLCSLVSNGPMNFTQLRDKFGMDESRLAPHLRLLWDRGLIEEEKSEGETRYVVTDRGVKVLKVVSPLIREAHKLQIRNFEAISNVLSGAGYS